MSLLSRFSFSSNLYNCTLYDWHNDPQGLCVHVLRGLSYRLPHRMNFVHMGQTTSKAPGGMPEILNVVHVNLVAAEHPVRWNHLLK